MRVNNVEDTLHIKMIHIAVSLLFFLAIVSGQGGHETGGVCESAPDQSPIDIIWEELVRNDDVCDSELKWEIKEEHSKFYVENTCHYVKVV